MNANTIETLAAFFDGSGQANWREAASFVEENLDEIDFDDESELYELTDISLCALKCDDKNIGFIKFLVSKGFDINYKLEGDDCLLLKYIKD